MSMKPEFRKTVVLQSGFSLMETLVAMTILTVGLMSIAGLQNLGLQQSRDFMLRTRALLLAQNALDLARASPGHITSVDYDNAPSASDDCMKPDAVCDPEALSKFDLALWKCLLGKWEEAHFCTRESLTETAMLDCDSWGLVKGCGSLPEGDGRLEVNHDLVTVSVRWNSSGGGRLPDQPEFEELTLSTKVSGSEPES